MACYCVVHVQVAQQVAQGTMRTKVLEDGGGRQAEHAYDLASHDLVMTTSERLSLEAGLGKASPLLKVCSFSQVTALTPSCCSSEG